MPRSMTPEDAVQSVCPHMNRVDPALNDMDHNRGVIFCCADACACWGWADPKEGQYDKWSGKTVGPRRGKCEAMSPNIEVSA